MRTTTKRAMVWRAEIPEAPPSANVYLRMHFREKKVQREKWWALVYAAFFYEEIPKASRKRTVLITIRSERERDRANLWTPADKLILDNLTRMSYIVDDSPKWLDVDVQGEVGVPRTIVEVRE